MIAGPRLFLTSPVLVLLFVTFAMFLVNLNFLNEAWGWGHNLFLAGVLAFTCTYLISAFVSTRGFIKTRIVEQEGASASSVLIRIYWIISLLGLILSLYRIYAFGIMGKMEGGILFNLRYVYIWEHQSNYGAQHFSLFALCLALYYAQKKRIFVCSVSASIYLVSAISLAERTSILFLFVSVLYTLFFVGWVRLKGVFVFFVMLILIFCMIAVATGRAGGDKGYDFLFSYFGYAVTALQQWIEGKEYLGCADLVFGKIIDIVTLGLYSCIPFDIGFADDDFNVLTYVSSPYLFGGVTAVLVCMALLGVWYAFLRRLACKKGGYFLALLSCYMYALVMVFYAWQFTLTTFIYVSVILVPLFYEKKLKSFLNPKHRFVTT